MSCRYSYYATEAECALCDDRFWCRWSKSNQEDEERGES